MKFHDFIDADGKEVTEKEACSELSVNDTESTVHTENAAEPEAKRIKLDDRVSEGQDKPPKSTEEKKKKNRGQNKSRPHMKHSQFKEKKLCP